MRVKLSYTVEEEDVLSEAAKIIGLSGTDLQHCVALFSDVQKELIGHDDASNVVNVNKCLEMIEDFRKALLNIDTRLFEVQAMIEGYDTHVKNKAVAETGLSDTLMPLVESPVTLPE